MLRHVVAQADVAPDGQIRQPEAIRHAIVGGRRLVALAGAIDPMTHLNLDFPAHRCTDAIVVERMEIGAAVLLADDGFRVAVVVADAVRHRGYVDIGRRRLDWQLALRRS